MILAVVLRLKKLHIILKQLERETLADSYQRDSWKDRQKQRNRHNQVKQRDTQTARNRDIEKDSKGLYEKLSFKVMGSMQGRNKESEK